MNNKSDGAVTVSTAETDGAFRQLVQQWNALADAAGGSVFLQHEWFDAAWAWRKTDSSLFILLAWRGDRLIGILPLLKTRKDRKPAGIRTLEFLTVPDTQVCDLIAAAEDEEAVVDALCDALYRCRDSWDQMDLTYLPDGAAALTRLKTAIDARGWTSESQSRGRNLFVRLHATWEAYYSTRTRSLKKANNLAANRLKKTGEIGVKRITSEQSDAAGIAPALDDAIEISRCSWKNDTGNSLDQPGPGAFIRTLTDHAARRGWLSLWLLFIDGKPVAMEYQLVAGGDVYALRADFDGQCVEISPGSHLMRTLLESLFERGLQRYYMGPGENAYKTRWTDEGETLHQLTVYAPTNRGRLFRAYEHVLKPFARSLRDAFSSKARASAAAEEHTAKA